MDKIIEDFKKAFGVYPNKVKTDNKKVDDFVENLMKDTPNRKD